MLGMALHHSDLQGLDPEYYKNLLMILETPLEALGLELTFAEEARNEIYDRLETVDLKPNGRNIDVTDDNKLEYVNLVARHRMTSSIREQVGGWRRGRRESRESNGNGNGARRAGRCAAPAYGTSTSRWMPSAALPRLPTIVGTYPTTRPRSHLPCHPFTRRPLRPSLRADPLLHARLQRADRP
jgi:hypothetical protein